jgi:hypothetical protein
MNKNINSLSDVVEVFHKLFCFLDDQRYEELLDLFTEDGQWLRKGTWCKGREEILRSLSIRSTTHLIRHVITNSYVERWTENSALLVSYMTSYKSDTGSDAGGAPVINGASNLFKTQTELLLQNNGWRIAKQSSTVEFRFAPAFPA